jgi:hypothetical protein
VPTIEQRDAALATANQLRTEIAELKDEIHADASWRTLARVVNGIVGGRAGARMTVASAIQTAPGLGPVKAGQLCKGARVSPNARIGDLTDRQRGVLTFRILRRWSGYRLDVLERIASTPRPYRKERAWLEAQEREVA